MWKHSLDTWGLLFRALQGHMSTPKQLFTLTAFSKESIIGLDLFISGGEMGSSRAGRQEGRQTGEMKVNMVNIVGDSWLIAGWWTDNDPSVSLSRFFSVAKIWSITPHCGAGNFTTKSKLRNSICKKTRPI